MLFHSRRSFLKAGSEAAGLFLVGPSALLHALAARESRSVVRSDHAISSGFRAPCTRHLQRAGRTQRAVSRLAGGGSPSV